MSRLPHIWRIAVWTVVTVLGIALLACALSLWFDIGVRGAFPVVEGGKKVVRVWEVRLHQGCYEVLSGEGPDDVVARASWIDWHFAHEPFPGTFPGVGWWGKWESQRASLYPSMSSSYGVWVPLGVAGFVVCAIWWRARQRIKPGQCPGCRYDLTGLPANAPCPECGTSRARAG